MFARREATYTSRIKLKFILKQSDADFEYFREILQGSWTQPVEQLLYTLTISYVKAEITAQMGSVEWPAPARLAHIFSPRIFPSF